MDITQATQMLTWLDEEHRRDRALLTELRHQVENQAVEISEQARQIGELEGRLAAAQTRIAKALQLEQALEQLKTEVTLMSQKHDEEHRKQVKEQTELRQLERENVSRALNEIRQDLEQLPAIQEQLNMQKAEDRRLGESLLATQAQLGDVKREVEHWSERLSFLENQRHQDNKQLTRVQQETSELIRRTEVQRGKMELLEEVVRRNEQAVAALNAMRDELRRDHRSLAESLKIKDEARERQMGEWVQEMARFEEQRKRHAAQMERLQQQSEDVQHALKSLLQFREEIRRDQNQVAEVQRLAEERQQSALEEWRAENEQRWTRARLDFEGRWNRQTAHNEEVFDRLKQLEEWRHADVDAAQATIKRLNDAEAAFRAAISELWRVQEEEAAATLEDHRRRLARIGEQVRKHLEG